VGGAATLFPGTDDAERGSWVAFDLMEVTGEVTPGFPESISSVNTFLLVEDDCEFVIEPREAA